MGQTMTKVKCYWCGDVTKKVAAEIRRQQQRGRNRFFCSGSCAAKFNNARRTDTKQPITKICLFCGKHFGTMTGARSVTFCSRSCASAGSVTDARRDAWQKSKKNLENGRTPKEIARRLWSREYWKYAKVQALLDFLDESYEFEFPVGHHIFDLALFAHKVLVEFDGTYHNDVNQRKADAKKTAYAKKRGWIVVRVATPPSTVIEASTVHTVLKK